jgi:formylglycine-generating enzyme required for sulfatase activity
VVVILVALAPMAEAGPWSQLPDAISRLLERPGDEAAERSVTLAETSLLREAQTGHLAATRSLFDIFASLVTQLPDGDRRLRRAEQRVAERLLQHGNQLKASDFSRAASAWSLAAELDPDSAAVGHLREALLPPSEAEPGQVWRAPVDGAELVLHPAMSVRMGCTDGDGACRDDEIYFRWVKIPMLWVEAHEVSNRRYRLCVEAGSCTPPEDPREYHDPEKAEHPVVGISWRQARSYARWAARRLPTEAEWERCARGEVANLRFPWGNARRRELANTWTELSTTRRGTAAAGSFPATGWGLSDIAGNVWEWCEDRYNQRFSEVSLNGGAARQGWGRVARGGSWRRGIDLARVSTRTWYEIGYAADDLGFRCVVDHRREISVEALVRSAQRAFPIGVQPGHEFDRAQLEIEDRRYLERRAITLYMVEGRMEEALRPAALRLLHEPRDPVATDIFIRFETEMLNQASGNGIVEVQRGLEAYRQATLENRSLVQRLGSFERQVILTLRRAVTESEARGDRDTARQAAELALAIEPENSSFQQSARRLTRTSGTTRVWSRDGKGMVWVESGRYRLGGSQGDTSANNNEQPAREVEVDGFWIDRTEVTNDDYRSCVQAGECTVPHRTDFFDNPNLGDHPVLWVDWFQARSYASWAGKRLATEAEWEMAARAGAETAYPWGGSWENGRANALGTEGADRWGGTAPVASFDANTWGIYDLIGNAAEWVEDVFNGSFSGAPLDGRAWYQETGSASERRRVVRGAGYDDPQGRQRVSRRTGRRPDDFHRTVGFRCVADE